MPQHLSSPPRRRGSGGGGRAVALGSRLRGDDDILMKKACEGGANMRQKDSDDLVRVGPGTVMGNLMRQYWLPAAMSSELKPDGEPMRLMLLGEQLIAFRDSAGRVGVMDHKCPHRCASLFLGRNEENGIRCVYHGWKYDTDGNCIDTPNISGSPDFKHHIKAKAYRTVERNGLVWVYMGERQEAPPLPAIEATLLPQSDVQISFVQRECNWLQALEGDIDTRS